MLCLVEMGRILTKSITWVLIKWILECSRHEYIHTYLDLTPLSFYATLCLNQMGIKITWSS